MATLASLLLSASIAFTQNPNVLAGDQPIYVTEAVGISRIGRGGRTPFATDAVQAMIVAGTWKAPKAGDSVTTPDGSKQTWEALKPNAENWFEGAATQGGYIAATVESPVDRTVLMTAEGNSVAYVNGEPRAGDPYIYGNLTIPVRLRKGPNELLFSAGRGRFRVQLLPWGETPVINEKDVTLPDLIIGQSEPLWASVAVLNPSPRQANDWRIVAKLGESSFETSIPAVPAFGVRKVPFRIKPPRDLQPGTMNADVTLVAGKGRADSKQVVLRVRRPNEVHKRTFVSATDGSVQYFAVSPALKPNRGNALILALHGASVEGLGHVEAYAQKEWATIVGPTNRRPFGFDWEDWGRLDAMEVLGIASATIEHDPSRVMLTGHSMGGHGTWSIGSTFPGHFAAIGPSAGWMSFWTYPGAYEPKDPTAVEKLLRRSMASSETLTLSPNLLDLGIYGLHGDADDNVPVTQLREMVAHLGKLGKRVEVHEEKGAGHWWDREGPGAECVDWQPMFDLFGRSRIPQNPLALEFVTVNPAVSPLRSWLRVDQQEVPLQPTTVKFAPKDGVLRGSTTNARMISIDYAQPQLWGMPLEIDGQRITVDHAPGKFLSFVKADGRWQPAKFDRDEKGAHRGGPFKQAFTNGMVFVYGTAGTPEENAWSFQKARYDAETFLYRGNGSVDVLSDAEFARKGTRDRNVILYGNADTNSAWRAALGESPIVVERGAVRVGGRQVAGDDVVCLFLRPRMGSKTALVGVVGATGLPGMRLTDRLPVFLSGVAYPDWVVFDSKVLAEGPPATLAAGFFDNGWRLWPEQSAWR